ncbi:uncharacterized protein LOC134283666 [Saccostrea cucullata]|uniref:uncharacterized protein LOC134283666 n=1 Tax=Saccostrea cuccullata TaxID=36930 RepID=UPI002ED165E7
MRAVRPAKHPDPEEEECLFERFVLSMAREVCQNEEENTILKRLNVNRTFVDGPFPHLISSTSSVPVEKENQQENLINSLKLGIALGTIFGFLFGVIVSFGVLGIFRNFQRRIKERDAPNTAPKATTLGEKDIKTGQLNDHTNNYMYCDIEDANYHIPKEMTCTGSSESGASYSYDCPPLIYNHLNEKNEGQVGAKYDHFREVSSDARMTNGDYKILEPLHSLDQMNSNKTGKSPINNEGAMSGQDTRTDDAYFVLEKEIQ